MQKPRLRNEPARGVSFSYLSTKKKVFAAIFRNEHAILPSNSGGVQNRSTSSCAIHSSFCCEHQSSHLLNHNNNNRRPALQHSQPGSFFGNNISFFFDHIRKDGEHCPSAHLAHPRHLPAPGHGPRLAHFGHPPLAQEMMLFLLYREETVAATMIAATAC